MNTPVEAFVKAYELGIRFALNEVGVVLVSLPGDMPRVPAWLLKVKRDEPDAFAFAVSLGLAIERGGGDVSAMLYVQEISIGVA